MMIALLKSLLGGGNKLALIILAACALGVLAYNKGAADNATQCRAYQLEQQLELVTQDRDRLLHQIEVAETVRKQFATQLLNDIQALERTQSTAKEFTDEVNARTTGCKPISDADAKRLRQIR